MDMKAEEIDPRDGQEPSDEVPFEDKPVESAPSASHYPAVPSRTTTTFPSTHPATSSPTTTPPMAEGLGFTGKPYSTYGVTPAAILPPMATAVSKQVASISTYTSVPEPMPRRYGDGYHRPAWAVYMTGTPGYAAPEPGYAMPAPGFTSLSGLRGPESCGGRSRGSGRSSNRTLTRLGIRGALRRATSEIVGDLTQEIRAKLEPLIPPQASPTTVGVPPYCLKAIHLVAGLTNTLGSLRSRPMPTPAVMARSPFIPRTAQPPHSHVENSTRAEPDRLGLTALRAMVDVGPYGSSDLGGDPSDDEPPSMTSASPAEDDDPEDPENPSGKKKKKERKTKRHEGRRSQEAKAIDTSKNVVNLPELTGKDLSEFAQNFGRFLRITGPTRASGRVKWDLLLQCRLGWRRSARHAAMSCARRRPAPRIRRRRTRVPLIRKRLHQLQRQLARNWKQPARNPKAVSCASSLISSISLHFASSCMVTASLTDRCMAASPPAACQPVLSRALLSVDCCLLPDVSWKSSTVVCYLLSVVVCCPLSIPLLPAVEHRHPLSFVCCLLSVFCCLQFVERRRPLSVVCCSLPDVGLFSVQTWKDKMQPQWTHEEWYRLDLCSHFKKYGSQGIGASYEVFPSRQDKKKLYF